MFWNDLIFNWIWEVWVLVMFEEEGWSFSFRWGRILSVWEGGVSFSGHSVVEGWGFGGDGCDELSFSGWGMRVFRRQEWRVVIQWLRDEDFKKTGVMSSHSVVIQLSFSCHSVVEGWGFLGDGSDELSFSGWGMRFLGDRREEWSFSGHSVVIR